ncbi:hypothetical protein [Dehalobacterium formicoaceticum]|uniref:hypothetical protein n=1 Tax=Dehalobacterium formicoaceticum TaxID=51515 RepID=UPI000B7CB884|nr:hypothetical protein [Dehalobacterium formicoaceticum]
MLRILLILFTVMLFPITSFAADWDNYWVSGWHDDNSNYDIYNLRPRNEKVTDNAVIMHNLDQDEWVRLEERFCVLYKPLKPYDVKLPEAWIAKKGEKFNPYINYYYDIGNNRLILGKQYQISPDEKWGLQYNDYYGSGGRTKSFLLKNLENGTIEERPELVNPGDYSRFYWLPDSTILFYKYSQNERQNVIYIFYPETKEFKKVISGSLYAYDGKTNQILFVKNEPKRENWTLDLSTRLEKREMNWERFYLSPDEASKVPISPEDLQMAGLKVITPEETVRYEHEIGISDQVIPVPYVFKRENKEFIPLRPLMESLGIKININQLGSFVWEYQVSYREKKFTLSEGEYINYKWQLFVTPDVLKKMGLPEFTISPIKADSL